MGRRHIHLDPMAGAVDSRRRIAGDSTRRAFSQGNQASARPIRPRTTAQAVRRRHAANSRRRDRHLDVARWRHRVMTHNVLVLAYVVNVASTWYLVGLIWMVQMVHYPLFRMADRERFPEFAARHSTLITWIVMPPMLLELASAILLVWGDKFPTWWAWAGLALVALIWISTFALQVPQHRRLGQGFDSRAHRILVVTNWVRTIAWTARGLLVLWPLVHTVLLRSPHWYY